MILIAPYHAFAVWLRSCLCLNESLHLLNITSVANYGHKLQNVFDALHDLLSELLMFKHKGLMVESEMNVW